MCGTGQDHDQKQDGRAKSDRRDENCRPIRHNMEEFRLTTKYLPGYLPGVAPTRLEERRGPLFTTRQKTTGLNGMIHEETHPCISCSYQSTFETIQT